MTTVIIRRPREDRNTQAMPRDDTGRGWSDDYKPKNTKHSRPPPEPGKGKGGPSPRAFRAGRDLLNLLLGFWLPEL